MSLSVLCQNCGQQVTVPDSYGRPKRVGCPECDSVCEIAGPAKEAAVAPAKEDGTVCAECGRPIDVKPGKRPVCSRCAKGQSVPAPAKSTPVKSAPVKSARVPAPLPAAGRADSRIEGTHEDDDRPYPVPADPQQKENCPNCKQAVPVGTIVCNLCGYHRETGAVLERVFEKVAKEWEGGLRSASASVSSDPRRR